MGYAALRLDDVATRAGVAKTTIYRRWPTKAELVQSAIFSRIGPDEMLPDTGSLRGDILALLDQSISLIATPEGRALAKMLMTERADPEVDRMCRSMRDASRRHRAKVVVRAQERGDIPADVDAILVVDSIFGVVLNRLIRFDEPVDRATCEAIVDLVVTGAEHGGGRSTRASRARRPR